MIETIRLIHNKDGDVEGIFLFEFFSLIGCIVNDYTVPDNEDLRSELSKDYELNLFIGISEQEIRTDSMTIKVTLKPGQHMNYHSHEKRDEVWNVIVGRGKTIVDGMEQPVQAGDVITMEAGCRHTVIAETELKMIEVQLGKEISVHDKRKYEME